MAINFSAGKISHLMTNSLWQFWVSFGILGGALMVALVAFALAKMGVSEIGFVLLAATLMGQTMGGVRRLLSSPPLRLPGRKLRHAGASRSASSARRRCRL